MYFLTDYVHISVELESKGGLLKFRIRNIIDSL